MKARHHLLSKCSLITQFVFRCVLARERLAATRRTPPGWILLRKIWNCQAESLFSQVSITVPFSSLFCPTQAQLAPSVAASAPAWGLCCLVHPPQPALFTLALSKALLMPRFYSFVLRRSTVVLKYIWKILPGLHMFSIVSEVKTGSLLSLPEM